MEGGGGGVLSFRFLPLDCRYPSKKPSLVCLFFMSVFMFCFEERAEAIIEPRMLARSLPTPRTHCCFLSLSLVFRVQRGRGRGRLPSFLPLPTWSVANGKVQSGEGGRQGGSEKWLRPTERNERACLRCVACQLPAREAATAAPFDVTDLSKQTD